MQTWGGNIKGHAWVPPIVPIFDRQIVPPCNSLEVNLAYFARVLSLSNSCWISPRFKVLTLLMKGTTRPFGESIAILMLWLE